MVVNASKNYTKPSMRANLVKRIKAGSKGGKPDSGLLVRLRW